MTQTKGHTNVFYLECECSHKLGGPQSCGWFSGTKTQEIWSKEEQILPSTSESASVVASGIHLQLSRINFFSVAQNKSLWKEEITTGKIACFLVPDSLSDSSEMPVRSGPAGHPSPGTGHPLTGQRWGRVLHEPPSGPCPEMAPLLILWVTSGKTLHLCRLLFPLQ